MGWSHKNVELRKRAAAIGPRPLTFDQQEVAKAEENQRRMREEMYARLAAKNVAREDDERTD